VAGADEPGGNEHGRTARTGLAAAGEPATGGHSASTTVAGDRETAQPDRSGGRRPAAWGGSVGVLAAVLLAAVAVRAFSGALTVPAAVAAGVTVFVSIVVQALPFLVLGTLVSAGITAFVPASVVTRVLPARPALAVPVAGLAGMALPGCDCGSVPVAASLVRRGVAPAAALAFLLAAPAVNPVVLVATAVAFPGRPAMVLGRLVGSLLASSVMGWLWLRWGRPEWLRLPRRAERAGGGWPAFVATCREDLVQAGGFLVLGAATAAVLNVALPPSILHAVAADPVLSVVALAVLAVLLSLCSQADAFVVSAMTQFSLTARLVFLVVGPLVDVKLFALQAGTFGRRFAIRFAPATFVVAVLAGLAAGAVLL
jgi:uncharacterized membrane protein YraQ (UPF0718 family)